MTKITRSIPSYEKRVLYFIFFLLGLNEYTLYIPLIVIYILLFQKDTIIKKQVLLYIVLNLIAITFIFVLGHEKMPRNNPFKLFLVLYFLIIIPSFLMQKLENSIQIKLLASYILGMGTYSLIVAGYSFVLQGYGYGYGNLYNPFLKQDINSPTTSNNLAIFSSMLMFYLFNCQKATVKVFAILGILSTLILATFLGGRTFFIMFLLSAIYIIIRPLTLKKTLLSIFIIFILSITLTSLENIIDLNFIYDRFKNGLESKRFQHYQHGLSELLVNPLGGYTVNQSIEKISWFHNIFLDFGRLGGWIPVACLLISILYVILKSFKKIFSKRKADSLVFLMFIISFLILQQDIGVEGDYRPYIILIMSSVILLSNTKTSHE